VTGRHLIPMLVMKSSRRGSVPVLIRSGPSLELVGTHSAALHPHRGSLQSHTLLRSNRISWWVPSHMLLLC